MDIRHTEPVLRPYQQEDIDFLKPLNSCALFNEQRTGKTPTALKLIEAKGLSESKILIVTTASTIYQWTEEYNTWLNKPCLACVGSPLTKAKSIEQWTHGLVLCIHSLKATKVSEGLIKQILKQNPAAVILDEAHLIRNSSTCQAKAMFALHKIPIKIALTGTPIYGAATDLFSILKFLFPKEYTSEYKWRAENIAKREELIWVKNKQGIPTPRKIVNWEGFIPDKLPALQNRLSNFSSSRKRKDVMTWLPKQDIQEIQLPLTTLQKKYLKELSDTYETESVTTQGTLDRLIRYRQICLAPELIGLKGESPKINWLLDFLKENPDSSTIVFSEFTEVLKVIAVLLKKEGLKYAMICGDVPVQTRQKFVKDFQNKRFSTFLLNTMACKEGLTLDTADFEIFLSQYPPVGMIEQAQDRFIPTTEDRIKPKTIYKLIMKESYDESLNELLQARASEAEVINNFKNYLKGGQH